MNKNFRPIRCVSKSIGFPQLTIENHSVFSKLETEPSKILGINITSYEIDKNGLTVTTVRDKDGSYLGDGKVLTITYEAGSEEYDKMYEYVINMFEVVPYEELHKNDPPESLDCSVVPCQVCGKTEVPMYTGYTADNEKVEGSWCPLCFSEIQKTNKVSGYNSHWDIEEYNRRAEAKNE